VDSPDLIPAAVRARDLVGYGRTPPPFSWPDDARVVINLVLVYEAGSEYSVAWDDDRNGEEVASAGQAALASVGVLTPEGQFASKEWFDMLHKEPESAQFLALGRNVRFAMKDEVVEVYE